MKIALIGYGKMGQTIEKLALREGHEIVLKINRERIDDLTVENLRAADVAIEFSTPQTVIKNILLCFEAGTPVIIGTTSWNAYKKEIEETCISVGGSMLAASNFSLGVNLFFAINSKLAQMMAKYHQYKVSVSEIHHTAKLDAPSGTAITLAEQIIEEIPRKTKWVKENSNDSSDLTIHSERIDPAPGTHHVKYSSDIDDIEIMHKAHNRQGFALGAVVAAEFLKGKKGVYNMSNII